MDKQKKYENIAKQIFLAYPDGDYNFQAIILAKNINDAMYKAFEHFGNGHNLTISPLKETQDSQIYVEYGI